MVDRPRAAGGDPVDALRPGATASPVGQAVRVAGGNQTRPEAPQVTDVSASRRLGG